MKTTFCIIKQITLLCLAVCQNKNQWYMTLACDIIKSVAYVPVRTILPQWDKFVLFLPFKSISWRYYFRSVVPTSRHNSLVSGVWHPFASGLVPLIMALNITHSYRRVLELLQPILANRTPSHRWLFPPQAPASLHETIDAIHPIYPTDLYPHPPTKPWYAFSQNWMHSFVVK